MDSANEDEEEQDEGEGEPGEAEHDDDSDCEEEEEEEEHYVEDGAVNDMLEGDEEEAAEGDVDAQQRVSTASTTKALPPSAKASATGNGMADGVPSTLAGKAAAAAAAAVARETAGTGAVAAASTVKKVAKDGKR